MWNILAEMWERGCKVPTAYYKQVGASRVVVTRRAGRSKDHWECYLTGSLEAVRFKLHSTLIEDVQREATECIINLLETTLEDLKGNLDG